MTSGKKNIILLPTYNERENIKYIIPEIFRILPDTKILLIDDNSPDKTVETAKELASIYDNLLILEREKKTGLGDAYKDGIKLVLDNYGDIETIITMDADGSHNPDYLIPMIKQIENYDLVIGSRYLENKESIDWALWRRLLSRYGNIYSKILLGSNINDWTAGFIAVKTDLLKRVDFFQISSAGYAYQMEFKYQCSLIPETKIKEVPIIFKSRREGESKLSRQIIREGLCSPLRIFLRKIWKKQ